MVFLINIVLQVLQDKKIVFFHQKQANAFIFRFYTEGSFFCHSEGISNHMNF
jgi:hypothetical protein